MIKVSHMIGAVVVLTATIVPLATADEASMPPVDQQAFVTCVTLAPSGMEQAQAAPGRRAAEQE